MKRILITGANSYIGTSFEKYMSQWPEKYQVDTVDMIDGTWRDKDFSSYDVVYHVAGIARIKETKKNAHLYYEINRDLPIEVAKKAKAEGVKQFIFMSSMSVYGMDTGVITKETKPNPKTNYGKSKFQAEEGLNEVGGESFKICVLRPPMIYGKDCKGNFQTVVKTVKAFPVFPKVYNQRSLLYIDNLSEFVRILLESNESGLFFPQNREKMNTTQMAEWVGNSLGKCVKTSAILGLLVKTLKPISGKVRKAFGNLFYQELDVSNGDYNLVDLEESIKKSV